MLSKLLTIAVVSVGLVKADGFADTCRAMHCDIADSVDSQEALEKAAELVATAEGGNVRNADRLVAEEVQAAAQRQCDLLSGATDDEDCADDEPNCSMRQLNQAVISPIVGGYGCWGNFPTSQALQDDGPAAWSTLMVNGRGPPKDSLDHAARDLVGAYKCIMEEYILETNGAATCDPWAELYMPLQPPAYSQNSIQGWMAQCEGMSVNGASSCNVKACLVETLFAARYVAWTYTVMNANNGYQVPNDDTTYFHADAAWNDQKTYSGSNPQFVNNETNCPVSGTVAHVYCCGEYPFRQRIHSSTSTDQCCNGVVYNDTTHQCCGDAYYFGGADGTLTPIADEC